MFKKRKSRSYETRSLAKMMKDKADKSLKYLCWIGDILVILAIAILSIGFILWLGI